MEIDRRDSPFRPSDGTVRRSPTLPSPPEGVVWSVHRIDPEVFQWKGGESCSQSLCIYQVTATFHPATESFTFLMEGRPLTDRTISVPQGIHIIVFTLETDP